MSDKINIISSIFIKISIFERTNSGGAILPEQLKLFEIRISISAVTCGRTSN